MPATRSMDDLVLHTTGGVLYFGTGRPQAVAFDHGPKAFAEQDWVSNAETVRILGTAENAALIVELHNQRLKHGRPQILIGSPSLCRLELEPPDVIRQLMELEQPASVGGWHRMGKSDFSTYSLMNEMCESEGRLTDQARVLLRGHPAYPALSFIPSLNSKAAIKFICCLADPRFRIDPAYPDSSGKLKQWFGLGDPGGICNAQAYLDTGPGHRRLSGKAEMVFDTWSSGWREAAAQDVVGPRDFLPRVVKKQLQKRAAPIALLRASHVFLRFVRSAWLDRLTAPRKYRHRRRRLGKDQIPEVIRSLCKAKAYCPTLFTPEHFFENEDEVVAWRKHFRGP